METVNTNAGVAVRKRSLNQNLKKLGSVLGENFLYLILIVLFVAPLAWMVLGSLREEKEIFANLYPFSIHTFWPINWTLDTYLDMFGISEIGIMYGLHFHRFMANSLIVSVAVVSCSLVFNTMGAYFFARLDFPFKNFLLIFVVATMLIPFQATIVPLYIVVSKLGMRDSFWGLIVPWFASPFVIFALAQFIKEIPKELDEAATIDGASLWGILWHVILPNAIPGIITMALLEFQFIWNLFYWPLIVINSSDLQMIQVAIANQTTQTQIFWGRTFAGSTLASLPVIIVFLALQKWYIQGVATTGLKG
jgi:multiple sugar transport system permease protein/putative chitobiose transport system permease protein